MLKTLAIRHNSKYLDKVKNKLIPFISALSIVLGISGYIFFNQPEVSKSTFDAKFSNDKNVFISDEQRLTVRISSIRRLAIKKDSSLRLWILSNFKTMTPKLKSITLEEIGYFTDDEVNNFIFTHLKNPLLRQSALRSLSKVENENRAKLLENVITNNFSKINLIDYQLSKFKTNTYFSKKKIPLNYLINFARKNKDSKELDYLVKILSIHVPNFEKLHELLKELLFKTESVSIIQLSIKHLAVYENEWLKLQMSKVFNSKNETKIKFYLDRAPVLCPLDYWKIVDENYSSWKEYILFSAFSINTKKAKEFLMRKEGEGSQIYDSFKYRIGENIERCY